MALKYALCGLFVAFILHTNSFAQDETSDPYFGEYDAVGDIRTSLLDLENFRIVYGPDWDLMDGGDVSGTPLSQHLKKPCTNNNGDTSRCLPDARGRFLRMLNNGAEGNGRDPDNRFIGHYQEDEYKKHDHGDTMKRTGQNNGGLEQRDWHWNPRYKPALSSGGEETRPKNIAVNFYVRVRCTTSPLCDRYFGSE